MASTFRYRGEDPSRIEALSDSCFAIAIGLLLISTKSPDTFYELLDFTRDLVPFALCITMIMWVWYQHFIFFIRYGLRNPRVVAYNTILLLIILFYVYPLKFLAKLLTQIYGSLLGKLFGLTMPINHISTEGRNLPELMIIYGAGVSGIFIVLMFMYRYALKNKEELGLNDIEVFETRISIKANLLMAGIPMLSALLALIIGHPAIAGTVGGITYLLYWPVMTIFGKKTSKQRKQILEKSTSIGFSSTSSG